MKSRLLRTIIAVPLALTIGLLGLALVFLILTGAAVLVGALSRLLG